MNNVMLTDGYFTNRQERWQKMKVQSKHFALTWTRQVSCKRQGSGFTLVEMLVVIAIIAILASFLMPALHKANAMAKAVMCANNLRQLYLAFNTYTGTFNDFFPCYGAYGQTGSNTAAWPYSIAAASNFPTWLSPEWNKRSGSVLFCPMATATNDNRYDRIPYGKLYYGVLTDGRIAGQTYQGIANWRPSMRITRVRRTGQTYLLGDFSHGIGWPEGQFPQRHGQSDNILYVDGHVEAYQNSTTLLSIHFIHVNHIPETSGAPYRYGD